MRLTSYEVSRIVYIEITIFVVCMCARRLS